jgi:hypothetical protein
MGTTPERYREVSRQLNNQNEKQLLAEKVIELQYRCSSQPTIKFRHKNTDLSELFPLVKSKSLTIMTFTLGAKFADFVISLLKKADDNCQVRIVCTPIKGFYGALTELIEANPKISVELMLLPDSHIKLLQADDMWLIGSMNLSSTADSLTKAIESKHTKNYRNYRNYEIAALFNEDGRNVANQIWELLDKTERKEKIKINITNISSFKDKINRLISLPPSLPQNDALFFKTNKLEKTELIKEAVGLAFDTLELDCSVFENNFTSISDDDFNYFLNYFNYGGRLVEKNIEELQEIWNKAANNIVPKSIDFDKINSIVNDKRLGDDGTDSWESNDQTLDLKEELIENEKNRINKDYWSTVEDLKKAIAEYIIKKLLS